MTQSDHNHLKAEVEDTRIWLKRETIAFILQALALFGSLVWGYANLAADARANRDLIMDLKVEIHDLKAQSTLDRSQHDFYLRRAEWDTRNKLVDDRLQRIEDKIDRLIRIRQ